MEIKYKLKDKVRIKEIDRAGVITAILIDLAGTMYNVRYFDNAQANSVYFYDFEIEPR